MTLTDEQKQAIISEYNEWENIQYGGRDKKARQKLGQFFTPPTLTIRMIEKFDDIKDKTVLDPTCGAGGLLAAMILAGADPQKVYGIELDPLICQLARRRLANLGVPPKHIKVGNALDSDCYNDFDNYIDNCDELAEEEKKKLEEEMANMPTKEEKKLAKSTTKEKIKVVEDKPVVEEKKVVKEVSTSINVVDHDQYALFINFIGGKFEANEIKFPQTIEKKLSFKFGKKAELQATAKAIEDKVNSNYWIICTEDTKKRLNVQFMLNGVQYKLPENKCICCNFYTIEKIATEQKFNSYDDIKKFLE